MRKPTAVIIGYGRMGREHERAYQECGVDVIATGDKQNWMDAISELIEPGYVSVCSYDDAHAYQIIDALQHGHKVIAEKPLCLTEDDLKRIYKLATPETLYCNLPLLEKDWPRAPDSKEMYLSYCWGRYGQLPGWRGQIPNYSFVLGAGVHITSLALHIKGRAIVDVGATGVKNHAAMDCETGITSGAVFADGTTVALNIDCTKVGIHEHRAMYGTDGMYFDITNTTSDKTAGIKRFIEGKYDRYHNSFAAHSVCFAIERALKSGKRETVEYLT